MDERAWRGVDGRMEPGVQVEVDGVGWFKVDGWRRDELRWMDGGERSESMERDEVARWRGGRGGDGGKKKTNTSCPPRGRGTGAAWRGKRGRCLAFVFGCDRRSHAGLRMHYYYREMMHNIHPPGPFSASVGRALIKNGTVS